MDQRRPRQLGDELESGRSCRREQLEQLAERRDGVVAGHDVREDEAARRRGGEDDAVSGRRAGELADASAACARRSSGEPATSSSTRPVAVMGTAI